MGVRPIVKPIAIKPTVVACVPRPSTVHVEAKRVCAVTGAKRNKANKVCFSNKKSRTFQQVNLQVRYTLCHVCQGCAALTRDVHVCNTLPRPNMHSLVLPATSVCNIEEASVLGERAALGDNQALS